MNNINIHRAVRVKSEIVELPGKVYVRNIVVTNNKGEEFEVSIFAEEGHSKKVLKF